LNNHAGLDIVLDMLPLYFIFLLLLFFLFFVLFLIVSEDLR